MLHPGLTRINYKFTSRCLFETPTDSGVLVEALEVLPLCLAPINDGVQKWWPVVGLRSHLHVDTVKHQLDSGYYGIKFTPLGLHI